MSKSVGKRISATLGGATIKFFDDDLFERFRSGLGVQGFKSLPYGESWFLDFPQPKFAYGRLPAAAVIGYSFLRKPAAVQLSKKFFPVHKRHDSGIPILRQAEYRLALSI